jgi:probable H4MPT-linked C1 transfer pathway protein
VVNVLGWDIGGANTKVAFIKTEKGKITEFRTAVEYFPFWKRDTQQLNTLLTKLKEKVGGLNRFDCVVLTMTAELSDTYRTKSEGINHILDCFKQVFAGTQILVLDTDTSFRSVDSAKAEPLKVAAANWVATGWMVAQYISDCVVVDVGSTTTSIIPVIEGKVAAAGKTDLEKLSNGELVYTGSLRTNVVATANCIPLKGSLVNVSSELFAQSGDVHLILGNISPKDYTAETADGQGKKRREALTRLARVICADTDMLFEQEIVQIARYLYSKQVEQIAEGINKVYSRVKSNAKTTTPVPVVVTGIGKNFLARKAAEAAGIKKIMDIDDLMQSAVSMASPAVGIAMMALARIEGRCIKWTL